MDPSFPINFSAPPLTTGLITSPAPQAPPLSALSALSAASASASAFTSAAPHPQLSHPYPHALHSQSQSQNQNPLPLLHQQQPFQQQAPRYHENRLLGLDDASEHFDGSSDHPRKKQKRNKPTLSCEDCVERKTKCDRGRPNCLACIKRQSVCKYAPVADVIEQANRTASNTRRMTKPPKTPLGPPQNASYLKQEDRSVSAGPSTNPLLSNVPHSHPSASNVFGIGSEHPFENYWTCRGGLPEVVGVFPDLVQVRILLEKYFETVDPVYPMLHRQTFYADFEHFWAMPPEEKGRADGALVALIFAMIAMGTQFIFTPDRQKTAEFYVSAAHQALRMSSYLNKASVRSIQTMVLITYFLINDDHASDGWAFAGILIRQAYALGLHRDPKIVTPNSSPFEKQTRRKLWQAVLLQDTFLTVLLSLPPSATHTDVNVEDLVDDAASIAVSNDTDTAYIRGCWSLANLVQETICSPRSLDLPICSNSRQKAQLLTSFRAVYRSFPDCFRSWDAESMAILAKSDNRLVRQTLFLTSNYHHNVMLLQSSASEELPPNVRGALDAAHDAINAFFLLVQLFDSEASVWWVFNHRAFLEATLMGNALRQVLAGEDGEAVIKEPIFVRAKADIVKMISIMQRMSEGETGSEVARTRVTVLSKFLY